MEGNQALKLKGGGGGGGGETQCHSRMCCWWMVWKDGGSEVPPRYVDSDRERERVIVT